eukprot:CAMPEP_0117466132 /NCGR_PEP_ID=MMETSP0784-20121206/4984_1 /TAXON_ID=39447 /ORGANISM="" /LENGTH=135 /DNA_ID=CAMNT_0005260063 /DNA_START=306 /DNA_END=714 /DNA_ORIENTATION=-
MKRLPTGLLLLLQPLHKESQRLCKFRRCLRCGAVGVAILLGEGAFAKQQAFAPDQAVLTQQLAHEPEHQHAVLAKARDQTRSFAELVRQDHLLDPRVARPLVVKSIVGRDLCAVSMYKNSWLSEPGLKGGCSTRV